MAPLLAGYQSRCGSQRRLERSVSGKAHLLLFLLSRKKGPSSSSSHCPAEKGSPEPLGSLTPAQRLPAHKEAELRNCGDQTLSSDLSPQFPDLSFWRSQSTPLYKPTKQGVGGLGLLCFAAADTLMWSDGVIIKGPLFCLGKRYFGQSFQR